MLSEMVGPDDLIRVSKNQSYAMRITSNFEVPGRCFELFVITLYFFSSARGLEPLMERNIILIECRRMIDQNVTKVR